MGKRSGALAIVFVGGHGRGMETNPFAPQHVTETQLWLAKNMLEKLHGEVQGGASLSHGRS